MSYFLKSGNTFRVTTKEAMELHEMLPACNYVIKIDPHGNLYLENIDSFNITGKIYGDTLKNTDRILNTFNDRKVSTGVMLCGEKGSGKTLLAKNICATAAKAGVPTIIVNAPFRGDNFNTLIQSIDQPCIVFFDEYEKIYDKDEQLEMLTLLDGVFPTKKLFLLTCNDKWRVDDHMRNRPGRIYYMIDFDGLDEAFVNEYCQDNLNDKSHIDKLTTIISTFGKFNFDMLKATVEEMNRYNESPQEAMKMINTRPEFSNAGEYSVELFVNEIGYIDMKDLQREGKWSGNPLMAEQESPISISFKDYHEIGDSVIKAGDSVIKATTTDYESINIGGAPSVRGNVVFAPPTPKNGREWFWNEIDFYAKDLVKIEHKSNRMIFKNDQGQLILTRNYARTTSYWDAF